jgi:hypothetical protein
VIDPFVIIFINRYLNLTRVVVVVVAAAAAAAAASGAIHRALNSNMAVE